MSNLRNKIKELRVLNDLSQAKFAAIIQEKTSKIADIETGKQRINEALVQSILDNFQVTANWLFGMDDDPTQAGAQITTIQSYNLPMSAGTGNLNFMEPTEESFAISSAWLEKTQLNPKYLCVFPVRGDSMERELSDGDLIIVDRSQNFVTDGGTYALRVDDEMLVKKIQRLPGRVMHLISNNPIYSPIEIRADQADDTVSIIGRVVTSIKQW